VTVPAALILVTAGLIVAITCLSRMRVWGMRKTFKWMAASGVLVTMGDAILHHTVLAGIAAAATAISIYWWWHGGGGDGTKKRLRSALRKFTPVRRTAPQTT
jgi:phosphatidylserine synthase